MTGQAQKAGAIREKGWVLAPLPRPPDQPLSSIEFVRQGESNALE
jgi:hypothetical protein